MPQNTAASHKISLDPEIESDEENKPWDRLPWETNAEFSQFNAYRLGYPRTVRSAYDRLCKASGKKPRKDPPSTWFKAARGNYAAFRKAERQLAAIEVAEAKHGRVVDWDAIGFIVNSAIEEGELNPQVYARPPYGEVMTDLKICEVAFMSLAIDIDGDPLPGQLTWEERLSLK